MQREPVALKNCRQLLLLADTTSFFTSCQLYFSISLATFCKRITLPLFVSIFHLPARRWWQWKEAQGSHKNGHIFFFSKKRKKERKSAAEAHVHFNFHLQSNPSTTVPTCPSCSTCSTFTASSETDSIYIISRTHNNSQLQPALLHEYIEGRFPATLFHDWTPKDTSEVGWKGRGKREMASETAGLNEVSRENATFDTFQFTKMCPLNWCSYRNAFSSATGLCCTCLEVARQKMQYSNWYLIFPQSRHRVGLCCFKPCGCTCKLHGLFHCSD